MVLPLVAHIVEIKDYLQCIVLDFFDNSVFLVNICYVPGAPAKKYFNILS